MSLEEATDRNTKALEALTAQLAKGVSVPAAAGTAAARSPGRPKAITLDEVRAIAEKLSEKRGKPAVRELIKEHGAAQLADMDKSKYSAFIAACEVLMNAEETGEEPGSDDL